MVELITENQRTKTSVVIPGHSKVGAALDASTALDFTENYLLVFEEELKKAKDADSLINTMKENSHPPTCSWQSNGAQRLMLNPDRHSNESLRDGCQ